MESKSLSLREFREKMDAGLQLAYERLVARKAKDGGSLVYSIDGKITEVPAAQLLEEINKSK